MISDCQGLEREMNWWSTEDLQSSENTLGFPGVSVVENLPASAGAARNTWVHSLVWEDSPGEGNGNLFQCSCWDNPMDKGAGKYSGCYYQYNDGQVILHVSKFM